jgi:hypothetical protein
MSEESRQLPPLYRVTNADGEDERVIALTTDQVKKITPVVIAGLFLLRIVRRRRRRRHG